MPYRFKRRESIRKASRRLVNEQFDALTSAVNGLNEVDIHEARRRCKMLRALLTLLSSGLDKPARRSANLKVRDIARRLSRARDWQVSRETLRELFRGASNVSRVTQNAALAALDDEAPSVQGEIVAEPERKTIALLTNRAREAYTALHFARCNWKTVRDGLRKAYRRGERMMGEANVRGTPEARHLWRKQAKRLWYDLRLLQNADPTSLKPRVERLELLTESLGKEHDVTVLRSALEKHRDSLATHGFDRIMLLLARRMARLRRRSDFLGGELYREKPAQFVRSIHRAWRNWRK